MPTSHAIVLSHLAERSVLHDGRARELQRYSVDGRKRHATCSGVAWLRDDCLAVVNLYGESLRIYRFQAPDAAGGTLARIELLHEVEGVPYPEDVDVSADHRTIAITHSLSADTGVSLRAMDPASLTPARDAEMIRRGMGYHGVSFTPDGRYLAFTWVGEHGRVEIIRSSDQKPVCLLECHRPLLKPKAISFSPDARFVVVAWSLNVNPTLGKVTSGSSLTVHAFDPERGEVERTPLSELVDAGEALANIEMCTWLPQAAPQPARILASNQGRDLVSVFDFDAAARTLTYGGIFAGGMSFPHGLDANHDGSLVAITNYGDDTLRVAARKREQAF